MLPGGRECSRNGQIWVTALQHSWWSEVARYIACSRTRHTRRNIEVKGCRLSVISRSLFTTAALYFIFSATPLLADEPVVWTNIVGASASGNTLTKTATTTAWDSGASSLQVIRDGYGYVEWTATETTTYRIAGLSHGQS